MMASIWIFDRMKILANQGNFRAETAHLGDFRPVDTTPAPDFHGITWHASKTALKITLFTSAHGLTKTQIYLYILYMWLDRGQKQKRCMYVPLALCI